CVSKNSDPSNCGTCGNICGGSTPYCFNGACSAISLQLGLIAYWKLDGNGNDSVGAHTLTGSPSWVTGKIGQAMSQSGNVEGLQTPTADFDFSHDFTISMWINWSGGIYSDDAIFDATAVQIARRDVNSSKISVAVQPSGASAAYAVDNSPVGAITTNTWYHI